MPITIHPLALHQIPEVKWLILSVAQNIFHWPRPLEDILRDFDEHHEFHDIDEAAEHYFGNQGLFLVAMDGDRVIGSGAVRRLDDELCELKRMWLLEDYHGHGIGYRIIQELFAFARQMGYVRIQLNTDPRQERAIKFYQRVGFTFIEIEEGTGEDMVFMERPL